MANIIERCVAFLKSPQVTEILIFDQIVKSGLPLTDPENLSYNLSSQEVSMILNTEALLNKITGNPNRSTEAFGTDLTPEVPAIIDPAHPQI